MGKDIFATQAHSPNRIEKREPYMPIEARNMSLIPSKDQGMLGSHYPMTTKEGGKASLLPGASNTFMHNKNRDNLLGASGNGAN